MRESRGGEDREAGQKGLEGDAAAAAEGAE